METRGSLPSPSRPWRDIQPDLSAEPYVFTTGEPPPGVSPFAVIREDEGVTVILTRAVADRLGLAYDYVAARITLRVNSTLTDVGLTALFSRTLAESGISCNVIAGLAHDHLFVDWDQAARAAGPAARAVSTASGRASGAQASDPPRHAPGEHPLRRPR